MFRNRTLLVSVGVVLFLAGGAILSFLEPRPGTGLGTTVALAGIVLVGWGWLVGRGSND